MRARIESNELRRQKRSKKDLSFVHCEWKMRLSLLQENQLQENYPRQRNEQNKKKTETGPSKKKTCKLFLLNFLTTALFNELCVLSIVGLILCLP